MTVRRTSRMNRLGLAILSLTCAMPGDARSMAAMASDYWSAPGRYVCRPAKAPKTAGGPYVVRLTPEGSEWIWNYYQALGVGKVPPGQEPPIVFPEQRQWQAWISAKVKADRQLCIDEAIILNSGHPIPEGYQSAPDPGPMPASLSAFIEEPPAFAEVVVPQEHVVKFDNGLELALEDHVSFEDPKYAYFRFRDGVRTFGTHVSKMPAAEVSRLLKAGGLSDSEQRIFKAVSILEGGFDSLNTYDTGWVSVGFIQFACLPAGSGALGQMLLLEKKESPKTFADDFEQYGVGVNAQGQLTAVCLDDQTTLVGSQAARQIIKDKRLASVFVKAGRQSTAFRAAQIKAAKQLFYPGNDQLSIFAGGTFIKGRVSDVIKSEAGMASLMDRKVNTGSLAPIGQVLADVVQSHGLQSLSEAAAYEAEIIQRMRYRRSFLTDKSLSQPQPVPSN